MKILRFEHTRYSGLGVIDGDDVVAFGNASEDFPDNLDGLIERWGEVEDIIKALINEGGPRVPLSEVKLLAPVDKPGKFLAIGMNYKKHRAESIDAGITPPRNQMWFSKQISSINHPHGEIIKQESTMMLDYEVELGFVIGKECYQVSAEDAKEHIFGYTVCNDVSMRDWQLHNMPERVELMIGKSHDTHGPIGPWIVTSDEIADPHKLDLKCYVNGELRQSSNTDDMIWNCYEQIEYLSSAMTLYPGDLIITGTPPGSGFSPRGASGLADKGSGDVVKCEIESIGSIENNVA